MATSSFQNIRTELASDITARLTTDAVTGVTVTEYPPTGALATKEDRVWIYRIRADQRDLTMGASGGLGEDLELTLYVYAPQRGGTEAEFQAASVRAETILASVENAVRTDPTISGAVLHATIASVEEEPSFDADGDAYALLEVTIAATANL